MRLGPLPMPDDGTVSGTPAPETRTSGATHTVIDENYPAEFRWVRRAVQSAMDALEADGVGPGTLGSVEIVLAEALNNVAEHAYPPGKADKMRLIIRRRGKSLMVEIRDKGRPMPKGRAPVGNHPMTEFDQHDSMPEGGYGWFLIRELVSDLVYDRHDDENFLVFRMSVKD